MLECRAFVFFGNIKTIINSPYPILESIFNSHIQDTLKSDIIVKIERIIIDDFRIVLI